MECIVLDSSSSPPPHPAKGVTEVAGSSSSSSSSSVESFSEQFTGKAAAVTNSKRNPNVSDSDSDSSSSSSASGSFLSKIATSGGAEQLQSAPVSAAADTQFLRKEPKSSYRTIRYFDEADASIT